MAEKNCTTCKYANYSQTEFPCRACDDDYNLWEPFTPVPHVKDMEKNLGRFTTLHEVMKIVDEWLNSDDTFITDGKGGSVIPNAWIDCKKGSLLKRMAKIVPNAPADDMELCTGCEHKFPSETMQQDAGENYFCKKCYDELLPVMKAEQEQVNKEDMEAEARELVAKFSSFETDFSYDGGYSFETLQRSDAEHCATIHLELMIEAFRKAGSDIMVRHYTQLINTIKKM